METELYTCIVSQISLLLGNQGHSDQFFVKWLWWKLFTFSEHVSSLSLNCSAGVYMIAPGPANAFYCASKHATDCTGGLGWYHTLPVSVYSHQS
jgi:hypothetical protein